MIRQNIIFLEEIGDEGAKNYSSRIFNEYTKNELLVKYHPLK
jgi:hypothetical protein